MTTPNIVPKFNEEGRVGRPSRRFYEIHGKFVYLDSLVLSVPDGQVITQSPSESESSLLQYPSANHLYFNEGRVVQGENILAWKSEVDELQTVMDALLGDGSGGLSTLSSVVSSIQALDTGEDSFIELVNKINAIEADYVTASQIASLSDISDLSGRMINVENRLTALEGQDVGLLTTVNSQTGRLDTLDETTAATSGAVESLSGIVNSLSTTVGANYTSLNDSITSAVGRVSTLEVNTIPTLSASLATLTANFDANVLANTSEFSGLTGQISTLSTDLATFNTSRLSDLSTLNTSIGNLSTSLNEGLALKLDTTSFATKLSTEFPTLSSTLLSGYVTDTALSSTLTSTLTGYASSTDLSSAISGLSSTYVSNSLLNSTLSGYASSSDLTTAISGLSSTYLATSDFTTTLNSAMTSTNLSSGGSLENLGNFVANTSQDAAEFAATTAVNNLTLDTIGTSSSTVDWSLYSFSIGSLLISSVNTFMCADPNIEFNVGQPREYLLEVPGGVTWKRGEEEYDAAILWDEENHIFHVRLAGPETYRLLTTQDYDTLNAEILSNAAQISTFNSNLTGEISALASAVASADQALSNRIDLVTSDIRSVESVAFSESTRLSGLISDGDAAALAAINALATSVELNLQSAVSALEASNSEVAAQASSNTLSITQLGESLTADVSRIDSAISSESARVNSLVSGEVARVESAVTEGDETNAQAIVDAESRLTAEISAVSTRVESAEQAASSDLLSAKSTLETSITDLEQRLTASISSVTDGSSQSLGEHTSADNPHGISKQTIGLANVENIGLSSWTGTSNIRTLGNITSGTWSASPVSLIADSAVGPAQIDSNITDTFVFQNVSIQGQLTVSGDTVQINSTEVNIGDNIIRLNADAVGAPTEDGGFEIERGDADNVSILWKESAQEWSIGDKVLEAGGVRADGALELEGASVAVRGEATFYNKVSVPHLDITSNMSLNTASSMIALNKDARYPAYPYVGTTAGGANTEDISSVASYAVDAYNIDGTNLDESLQLDNDSGLKVVLGGANASNQFKYAFLFWDVSESKWRLSESAETTEETDSNNSVERTEIVDTTSNVFDVLHSGHVGASGSSSMGTTKLQVYSAGLTEIGALSPANGDFIVRNNGAWASLTTAQVKALITYTTDDVAEGNNSLYYTTARVRGAIGVGGDLSYNETTGVISYTTPAASYTSTTFGTDFASKDTDDLSEGSSNLYYTDARARGSISVSGSLSYNSTTGVLSFTQRSDAAVASIANTQIQAATTDDIDEGNTNLYHTTARARSAISVTGSLAYNSTTGVISYTQRTDDQVKSLAADQLGLSDSDDVAEGSSNLYFTDARARSSISAAGDLSYNSTTGVLSYSTPTTTGVAEGDNQYFTSARARSSISASGSLSYNSTTGVMSFTQRSDAAVAAIADTQIAAADTDDLSEGTTNQYFTTARARGAFSAGTGISISNGSISATTQRTDAQVTALAEAAISNSTTDDVAEGDNNLYYTTGRVRGALSGGGDISYDSNTGTFSFTETGFTGKDTDDLPEGSNLYFTEARARAAISAGSGISISNGQVSVNADLSSVVSRINMQTLFQKGSAWDRSAITSDGNTATSITLGYTTDGHAGPWQVTRKLSIADGSPYMAIIYRLSSGINQYKSLPDTNFTLTTSASGANTVHSLTLA